MENPKKIMVNRDIATFIGLSNFLGIIFNELNANIDNVDESMNIPTIAVE